MTPADVKAIVSRELDAWRPPLVPAEHVVGNRWTLEKYDQELQRLRAALVEPYEQRFQLQESDDPSRARISGHAEYWVVAATKDMLVWYDQSTGEFGVGEPRADAALPVSVGLRGDLVGSFSAW